MKEAIVIVLVVGIQLLVILFAFSHAVAAKHEPPAIIFKRRITVIYNLLFNRRTN